jgi:hypothetical protein
MSYPIGEEGFFPGNSASGDPMSQELAHFSSQIALINPPVFPNFKQINCASRLLRDTISIARRQPAVQQFVQADRKQRGGFSSAVPRLTVGSISKLVAPHV